MLCAFLEGFEDIRQEQQAFLLFPSLRFAPMAMILGSQVTLFGQNRSLPLVFAIGLSTLFDITTSIVMWSQSESELVKPNHNLTLGIPSCVQ
jgi:hypothetical protein